MAPDAAAAGPGGRAGRAHAPGRGDVRDPAVGAELGRCGGGGEAGGVAPQDRLDAPARRHDLSPLMGDSWLQRLVVRGPAAEVTAFRRAAASREKPEYRTIERECETQKLSFAKLRTLIPG